MRVDAPWILLLLGAVAWFSSTSRSSAAAAPRRWCRVAAMTLLVLAASALQIPGRDAPISVMFVVDRSESMTAGIAGQEVNRLGTLARGMRGEDAAGVIVFGANAAIERPLERVPPENRQAASQVVGSATDLESALALARTALPAEGDRRIVLLSDGQQTRGDAMREAARAAAAGIRIDVTLPSERQASNPLSIDRLSAPATVRSGEPFSLIAIVRGAPGRSGAVLLRDPDGHMDRREIVLDDAGTAREVYTRRAAQSGAIVFEAYAEDAAVEGDFVAPAIAGAAISVLGPPRLLYATNGDGVLVPVLAQRGFEVDRATPRSLPRTAAGLAAYDAVILDEVSADRMEEAQQRALQGFVSQQGGGLLVLGGPETLEAGALADSPLGGLLPVDFGARRGERAPSLALVVAFDKSGSMDDRVHGVPRIEFARQAVRRVLDTLAGSDALGVIAFDDAAHEVAPLEAAQDMRAIEDSLAAVVPGGPTAVAPALEVASRWLEKSAAARERRHVLLVSDGRTSPADAARARALAQNGGFELSVVALGTDADRRFLDDLARLTGGRAYFPEDIRELPALAARESARVAGGRLVQSPFQPRAVPHPVLARVDTSTLPTIGGYVAGSLKASARAAIVSPADDPILATWRVGLGNVGVYSASLGSRWSAGLRAWPGAAALFSQTVRWLSRRVRDDALYAAFEEDGDDLRVVLETAATDGGPPGDFTCEGAVRGPDGEVQALQLDATAPGRCEARLDGLSRGAHVATLSMLDGRRMSEARVVRRFYWSADAERRTTGINHALLERLAARSGGRVVGPDGAPFLEDRQHDLLPLRPWLATAALLLFLGELFLPSWFPRVARARRHDGPAAPAHETAA